MATLLRTVAPSALILALPTLAYAAPFGTTVLKDGGTMNEGCAGYHVVLDAPLTVSASSRVYVDGTGSLELIPQQPPGQRIAFAIVVTTADGSEVLATTADVTNASNSFEMRGVLHEGTTPWDVAAQSKALQPGNYHLQARYQFRYDNCGFQYGPTSLSYIVLSAVLDRVFADSFS